MADGCVSSASAENLCYSADRSEISTQNLNRDCKDLVNLIYDSKRLKWVHDFDSLKTVIVKHLGLWGKWSSPGGSSKKFKCINADLTITWYHKKQYTLLFQGKDGDALREKCVRLAE